MPGWLDVALVLLFALAWPAYELLLGWPSLVRAVGRGEPNARWHAYRETIVLQWLFVAAAMAITLAAGRSPDTPIAVAYDGTSDSNG